MDKKKLTKSLAYFVRGWERPWYKKPISVREISRTALILIWTSIVISVVFNSITGSIDGLMSSMSSYEKYRIALAENERMQAVRAVKACEIRRSTRNEIYNCLVESFHNEINEANKNLDLDAQREMAVWARYTTIVSALGLIVSAIGLIALFMSLGQTRKAIKDTREIGEKQLRAYISVLPGKMQFNLGMELQVSITSFNKGNTPAKFVREAAYVDVTSSPTVLSEEAIRARIGELELEHKTISSNTDYTFLVSSGINMTSSMMNDIMANKKNIIVAGLMQYIDIFDNDRETEFCFVSEFIPVSSPQNREPSAYKIVWSVLGAMNHAS